MNRVCGFGHASLGIVLLFAGLAVGQSAAAQQLGFYVGVAYGQTSKEAEIALYDEYASFLTQDLGFIATSMTSRIDEEDSGYGFVGGYRFTPYLAVEGGYSELGAIKYHSSSPGIGPNGPDTATVNVDNETSGIMVTGLGILPLSYRMELYARLGVMLTTTKFKTFYREDIRGELAGEVSESSTDFVAGAGVTMSFLEIYGLRLEYQRVFDAGKESVGEADLDMLSLGITVTF